MKKLTPMPPRPSDPDSGVLPLITFLLAVIVCGGVIIWVALS
jgi:hypothetical protein